VLLTNNQNAGLVSFNGTHYAFATYYYKNTAPVSHIARVWYTTNPAGTWSYTDITLGTTQTMTGFSYGAGNWYAMGSTATTGAPPWFAYTADLSSPSWTKIETSAGTGYPNQYSNINDMYYDGSQWVSLGYIIGYSEVLVKTTSANPPTSGWVNRAATGQQYGKRIRKLNDYWIIDSVGSNYAVKYTTDLDGTWNTFGTPRHVAFTTWYGSPLWTICGNANNTITLSRESAPTGTYLSTTSNLYSSNFIAMDAYDGMVVIMNNRCDGVGGGIRYFDITPINAYQVGLGTFFAFPTTGMGDPDPFERLIGGFSNCSYVTTADVGSAIIKVQLWKAAKSGPKLMDSVNVDATMLIDYDSNADVVVLRTSMDPRMNSGGLPGHIHILTTNQSGTKLNIDTYDAPSRDYTYYGGDQLGYRSVWVSGDGQQVGFLIFATNAELKVHSTQDFSLLWTVNLEPLLAGSGWEPDDYSGYVVGIPKSDRFLFITTDWSDQDHTINIGQNFLRLCNTSGTILSTLTFMDPFVTSTRPYERWAMHPDGSATYVRTLDDSFGLP
jgi:hypothetical protein